MRRTRLITNATGAALMLAATPLLAHDGDHHAPAPTDPAHSAPSHPMMPTEAREAWLAECRDRTSGYGGWGRNRAERCAAYLDDYYAYYENYRGPAAYGQQAVVTYAYAGNCCQPVMMVPVAAPARAEPVCKETVEYEYVDVPVRAAPRPAPQKRVKAVPQKRIPVK